MWHLISIAVLVLSLGACTSDLKGAAGGSQQHTVNPSIVDIVGAPLAEWSLNERRGRSVPEQSQGDMLPRRGIRLLDDGQRVFVLDPLTPRLFEASSNQVADAPSSGRGAVSSLYSHGITSLTRCPHWNPISGSAVLPTWTRNDPGPSFIGSSVPLLARYDSYDVAQVDSGVRFISKSCARHIANLDPELQQIENLGQLTGNDVRFGLEVELSLLPFHELETAIAAWGGQIRFQELSVQACELSEFWEQAIDGEQRILHMRDEGMHFLEIQLRVNNQWKLRTSVSFGSEAEARAYLTQHGLPSNFHRFNYGWQCSMTQPVNLHGVQINGLWIYAMQLDQLPPTVHHRFEMNGEFVSSSVDGRYASNGDDLATIVAHIEAEIQSKLIRARPMVHYWSEIAPLDTDSFEVPGANEMVLLWELVLPPLQLEAARLDEVRRLRQALKAARPNQHLDVRSGQPTGLHINIEIPQSIIDQGDSWEVARRYLVFWMRHRQKILDSYFSGAELAINRHQYFGPIPNSVVDELEALDLSSVNLVSWLTEQLEGITPSVGDIDVNIEHADEGRLEVRVSSNDLSEPWQNVEARIRFCVGLMRYILLSLGHGAIVP